jgi:hypothetical protein
MSMGRAIYPMYVHGVHVDRTGARVHRGNQLETGREADTILGAGDYDLTGLKRLP